MRWFLPSLVVLAACGSSWQIRKDEVLEIGCPEKYFYPDADGDGWGDASAEPVASCEPLREQDLTAANGRDCDDGDPTITGRVGAICPEGLLASSSTISFGGVLFADQEFVFVHGGSTPVASYAMATTSCQEWSGSDLVDDDWVPRGSLATFNALAELVAVQDELEAQVQAGTFGVFAGYVGIGWEGGLQTGAWSWLDDSGDNLINQIPWCSGALKPADFFPRLNPDDPEHIPALEEAMGALRLALVLPENGNWCLGMPRDAIPVDIRQQLDDDTADLSDPVVAAFARYTRTEGHFVCERPKPDPSRYQEYTDLAEE